MTVGFEIECANRNFPMSKVCKTELKVSTVRSVKFFMTKAVECGVVVAALKRKMSGIVIGACHSTTVPSGIRKVAANISVIDDKMKVFWSLSSRSWFVPVKVPLPLSLICPMREESRPGG